MESIYSRLSAVQTELKAPKSKRNTFGKYNYRSCEDILEAAKPILARHGLLLTISDEIVMLGDRYYIRAEATIRSTDKTDTDIIVNTALARESPDKKGMDDSQITGTASSYARKYALNGLLCIDDTKDADTDEYRDQTRRQDDSVPEEAKQSDSSDSLTCDSCFSKFVPAKYDPLTYAVKSKAAYSMVLCPSCAKKFSEQVKAAKREVESADDQG